MNIEIKKNNQFSTLNEILNSRATYEADKKAYTFLSYHNNDEIFENNLTFGELDREVRRIAAWFQEHDAYGERALLLYPPGLEYIIAYLGCLYSGVIAVPVYPPMTSRLINRFQSIVVNSGARYVMTISPIMTELKSKLDPDSPLASLIWIATDKLESDIGKNFKDIIIDGDTIAFLQYTSGSTSDPKGIIVTHKNLLHNLFLIYKYFGHNSESRGVIWLPPYHDMGLIGGILQPLYGNFPCTLISPLDFLQKPFRWLQAISRYKATTSGGPNFAYELCTHKITPEQIETLDLSSWDLAFNGAEPIRVDTLDRFTQIFAPCGFKREAFYPCYGLAESTLIVSGGNKGDSLRIKKIKSEELKQNRAVEDSQTSEGTQTFIGCGSIMTDGNIVIVDPESLKLCLSERVGEIWVSSPSVAQGYWNWQVQDIDKVFKAYTDTGEGPFLRTGDLGFFKDGELFVTGRIKDVIIIRGKNYYPQDIELTVQISHNAFRVGCGAAFSIVNNGEEQLVIVQEVKKNYLKNINAEELIQAITLSILEQYALDAYDVLLIKPGSIPKTSSGKLQHYACREGYINKNLEVIAAKISYAEKSSTVDKDRLNESIQSESTTASNNETYSGNYIQSWIKDKIAKKLNIPIESVDMRKSFTYYGFTSIDAVDLSGQLEELLKRKLSPTLLYDYPSIEALSKYLTVNREDAAEKSDLNAERLQGSDSIAIIGAGCRFPGGVNSLSDFWEMLLNKRDAITEVPFNRWGDFYESEQIDMLPRWGGFIEDIDAFDASFFGITPLEAECIDPQQRLLLEVGWTALEHAGLVPSKLAGSKTGIFVGISNNDYGRLQYGNAFKTEVYAGTGNAFSIAANRLSYLFDFRGPSVSVDTACSSSLVALHLACQSLKQGESDIALTCGVNLILSPDLNIIFSKAGMLASDGRCKTFDASADGYTRGEGCGVVVLKRLQDAEQDHDTIIAIVKGSAVNQDGRSNGITAPNGPAQKSVIRQALENAGVSANQIGYIEAHGTGTSLGDPIEINSITSVLSENRSLNESCFIGSVKTNIGHLESAAGMASLIKCILILQHGIIPANLHLKKLNPLIDLEKTPFSIPTEFQKWPDNRKKLVGISSFGFGGTNAHVILGHYKDNRLKTDSEKRSSQIILLSAKNEERLKEYAGNVLNFLKKMSEKKYIVLLRNDLLNIASNIIKVDQNDINVDENIIEFGFDQFNASTMCNEIDKTYSIDMNTDNILKYQSIKNIADYIFNTYKDVIIKYYNNLSIDPEQGVQTGNNFSFDDVAYTLQLCREPMEERLAIVTANVDDLIKKLDYYCQGKSNIDDLYQSNIEKNNEKGEIFIQGKDENEFFKNIINEKNLGKLAKLWVSGVDFDWKLLYSTYTPNRINMPTYPFAKDRYWIPDIDAHNRYNYTGNKIHPLLDFNSSTLIEQKFTSQLTGKEFYLRDHIVREQKLLPGVAYLEMACAAGEIAGEKNVKRIKNIIWERPIAVSEAPQQIDICLYPNNDYVDYEVRGSAIEKQKIVYSHGELVYNGDDIYQGKPEVIDIAKVKERCVKSKSSMECYTQFHDMGLKYGASFQAIQELFYNEIEALSLLELPEICKKDFDKFLLHPALMDGAFQTVIGLMNNVVDSNETYVPYAMDELQINKRLTEKCYAYVKLIANQDSSKSGINKISIKLIDEYGDIAVEMKNLALMSLQSNKSMYSDVVSEQNSVMYFHQIWDKSDNKEYINNLKKHIGNVLIFGAHENIYNELQKRLEKNAQFILVEPGEEYQCIQNNRYKINPHNQGDYSLLMDSLINQNFMPNQIIYIWSEKGFPINSQTLNLQLDRGIYSVFNLSKELMKRKINERVHILYVYQCNSDEYEPQYAALSGFAKSIRLEYPTLIYKIMGIDALPNNSSDNDQSQLIDILSREIHLRADHEFEIRYIDGQRYVKHLKEIDLKKDLKEEKIIEDRMLKNDGVYLITGGLGGLGLIFAEHLVKQVKANVVLSGRSDLNDEKRIKIAELESFGSEVVYIKADVSKFDDVGYLVAEMKSRYKKIDGIIHSAAVNRDSYLLKKTGEEIEEVLASKVHGTMYLDEALKDEYFDFFILFSSIAGVMGNLGQSDYAYANCFMDNFSLMRERLRSLGLRHGKTYSIDWPLWEKSGMKMDDRFKELMKQSTGMAELNPEDGIKVFENVLRLSIPHITVIVGDKKKIKDMLEIELKDNFTVSDIKNAGIAYLTEKEILQLRAKTENYLKEIVSRETKLLPQKINSKEPFEKYGIDSIMTVKLTKELEGIFGELSKTLFFEYQNIKELAEYFIEHHIDQVIEKVGIMSKTGLMKTEIKIDKEQGIGQINRSRFIKLNTNIEEARNIQNDGFAIIGISGRYPQSKNLDEFWEGLKEGKNCITEIPKERWDHSRYYHPDKGALLKTCSNWGGFLEDVDQFDPLFFNISPREAKYLDPEIRLFLEIVWESLEDAGYTRSELGENVGVFIGCMYQQYPWLAKESDIGSLLSNNTNWTIANRISYFYNFHGPSLAVNTACSSSLTAIHLACESIKRRECNTAVAGGVNLSLHYAKYLGLSYSNMLGSSERSRSFGNGDGYIPGEGIGAVLLKPLLSAIEDRDSIYCVIKGSFINTGGKTNGFMVPNPNAQAELIAEAFQRSGIDPRTISYIESAANGSELGDPIEITGLTKAFKQFTDEKSFCAIGSVKSNIGHLEAASGISGLTKIILQMKHRMLVPSINAEPLNPNINFKDLPFYLQKGLIAWERPKIEKDGIIQEYPRMAAINSFGAGGANCHVIVEEYQPNHVYTIYELAIPLLFIFSTKSKEQLKEYLQKIRDIIATNNLFDLRDVAYTLQVGREAMTDRIAIIAESSEDLLNKCNAYINRLDNTAIDEIYEGTVQSDSNIDWLMKDDIGYEFIDLLFAKKELSKIAQLWVQGIDINWKKFYKDQKRYRVPLPTYVFKKKSYWISNDDQEAFDRNEEFSVLISHSVTNINNKENQAGVSAFSELDLLRNYFHERICYFLGINAKELNTAISFNELGLDSINSVKLKYELERDLSLEIPMSLLGESRTIDQLIKLLAERIEYADLKSNILLKLGSIPGKNEIISDYNDHADDEGFLNYKNTAIASSQEEIDKSYNNFLHNYSDKNITEDIDLLLNEFLNYRKNLDTVSGNELDLLYARLLKDSLSD